MSKIIVLFLLSLLIPNSAFSQNTYPRLLNDSLVVITTDQLKQSDLIFLEHNYLKETNGMLARQISGYKELTANYEKSDSIQKVQLKEYENKIKADNVLINKLESEKVKIKRRSKIKSWFIGTLGVSTAVLALLMTL